MDYCQKGQWVVEQIGMQRVGLVSDIIKRRDISGDGKVIVQFGAGGPFERHYMRDLREATGAEAKFKEGI